MCGSVLEFQEFEEPTLFQYLQILKWTKWLHHEFRFKNTSQGSALILGITSKNIVTWGHSYSCAIRYHIAFSLLFPHKSWYNQDLVAFIALSLLTCILGFVKDNCYLVFSRDADYLWIFRFSILFVLFLFIFSLHILLSERALVMSSGCFM